MEIKQQDDAKKQTRDREGTLELLTTAKRVLVSKGKKLLDFDRKAGSESEEEILEHVLGRSGTLRAPTIRRGKTLVVGFHEDAYGEVFS